MKEEERMREMMVEINHLLANKTEKVRPKKKIKLPIQNHNLKIQQVPWTPVA
jgi:hypothetical protein